MTNLLFSQTHQWIRESDHGLYTLGISDFAQIQLSDIVFIQLPIIHTLATQGEELAVIESVKTAGSVLTPITGEVIEINNALLQSPELLNEDPFNLGWIAKMKMTGSPADLSELMTTEDYQKFLEN